MFCACGCGQVTKVIAKNNPSRGQVAGTHRRFIKGHNARCLEPYVAEDRGHETECWIWQLTKSKDGHGRLSTDDGFRMAHIVYWERANGQQVAAGQIVHHLCEVTSCVNPDHLVPMTIPEHQRLHVARLDWDSVNSMRSLYAAGARQCDLAAKFGVHAVTVHDVVHNVTWRS